MYREDFVSKTHDSGLADRKFNHKKVWVFPNEEKVERCMVWLVEKYLGLCAKYYKKSNLYLQFLQKPTPKNWNAGQVVGTHTIRKVVSEVMKQANIPGFLMNHLLRCSGGTRLFRGGIDRKLVKECMGHHSDAVDTYQVMSMQQREHISNVLKGQTVKKSDQTKSKVVKSNVTEQIASPQPHVCKCTCGGVKASSTSKIVSRIISESKHKGKVVVKVELELHNDTLFV